MCDKHIFLWALIIMGMPIINVTILGHFRGEIYRYGPFSGSLESKSVLMWTWMKKKLIEEWKKKNSVPEWAAKGMSFLRVERKKQHMDKGGI